MSHVHAHVVHRAARARVFPPRILAFVLKSGEGMASWPRHECLGASLPAMECLEFPEEEKFELEVLEP